MPDTPALSEALPLIVYGLGELLFNVAPPAGLVIVDEGAVMSTVMVLPAEGVSILEDESVALL